ncbi:MAG TPA: glycosyltransferase [Candidatus Eisenbacteria bacterium]
MRSAWDVVWLSDIPWGGLWQRPQQLASRFPDEVRILFVEPLVLGRAPALLPLPIAPRVHRVSIPFLPLHARSPRIRRLAYRLGGSAPATRALFALQRGWAASLRGFGRRGARRLALVQNFLAHPFLGAWRAERVIYDMVDAPLHFAPVPPLLVPHWEALLGEADRVVVTSSPLAALARAGGARAPRLIGNGVEASRFAGASPARLPGDPGAPAIGYVGSVHSWFDLPLVRAVARALPDARVVLVGPAPPSVGAELRAAEREERNLHWLGPRPYEDVPALVRAFRVGIIPFRRTPLTEAVNPVKLYEYAAAGVPCVTTRFTEDVEGWREAARVAENEEAFVDEVRAALGASGDPERLRSFARRHDWSAIATEFVSFCLEDAA